ncbi:anthranilate synthase component 1, partial [Spiromyces aspiralis]
FEIKPSFDEVRSLISETKGNLIPVYKDIPDDFLTPVTAYLKLSKDSTYSFLLESVIGSEVIGRFSFVGVDPYKVIKTGPKEDATGDPLLHLDEELKRFNYISIPNLPISG